MPNEIALHCALNVSTVPAGNEPRLLYLLVDTQPSGGMQPLQAPVNLAMVLDVSESMRLPVLTQEQFKELAQLGHVTQTVSDGVPVWTFKSIPERIRRNAPSNLEAVQASIAQAVQHLEAHDRVSLIAFADRAQVLLEGVAGSSQRDVLSAVAELASISLGDETEIAAGLQSGISAIGRGRSDDMVSRALILTDGFTRDPDRVMHLAEDARKAGIAVSTLGIGTEFNEKLLVEMADASLGNAYFCRAPQEIPPAFGQELAVVQTVALRDVSIDLTLSAGVEVRRAYRVRPAIANANDARREGRALSISTGDLDPSSPPAVLVELIVPTQKGGSFRIAQVSVTHGAPGQPRETVATANVLVKYEPGPVREEPDPTVMNTVERVSAYVLQTRALDDMAVGNMAAATQKLRAAATRLLSVGEDDLARAAEGEAARLEQSGQVSPEGAKELRYATRKLSTR